MKLTLRVAGEEGMGLDSSQGWATIFCCHHHATIVTPGANAGPFALTPPLSRYPLQMPPDSVHLHPRWSARSCLLSLWLLWSFQELQTIKVTQSKQALSSQNHEFSLLEPQSSA